MVLITIVRWGYVHQLSYLGGTTLYGISSMFQPGFPAFPAKVDADNKLSKLVLPDTFRLEIGLEIYRDQETSETSRNTSW